MKVAVRNIMNVSDNNRGNMNIIHFDSVRHKDVEEALMKTIDIVDNEWCEINVVFNKNVKKVRLRRSKLRDMAMYITSEFPQCVLHMQACMMLRKIEDKLYDGSDYHNLDVKAYEEERWSLLKLWKPSTRESAININKLGRSPLSDLKQKNTYLYNMLLYKNWRSKRDADAGLEYMNIRNRMIDSLFMHGKKSFLNDRYLPAIVYLYMDESDREKLVM